MSSSLSCGIIGLPNVGKSTLFNALTAAGAAASNFPFCTIEPNVGIVPLFDPRLKPLAKLFHSEQIVYAPVRFVDIAGLVAGASKGEGLGNQFLGNIRQVDAILHVVRCFDHDEVIHVSGEVDPIRDIETISIELALSDLQVAEKLAARLAKQSKGNQKEALVELQLLERVIEQLNRGQSLRLLVLTDEEKALLAPHGFLTLKPILFVANLGEDALPGLENPYTTAVRSYAEKEGSGFLSICAAFEAEISQMSEEDRKEFLKSVGLEESGLQRLVRASFDQLGLITFLTAGEMETRAWTIRKGTLAAEAAGKIHSDIQKGFIRAEVIAYDDMIAYGSRLRAKEEGKLASHGRDYEVKDGDVILFLHK